MSQLQPPAAGPACANLAAFRAQFPVCREMAYFQTAYRGPLHQAALGKLAALFADHARRGAEAREDWFKVYPRVAKRIADWHGAPIEWMAFTPNVSWTMGAIAHGLDWRSGDEILIPDNEFPANVYPWMTAAQRHGAKVRKVPVDGAGLVSAQAMVEAIGPRTRLIAASHVNFATGHRLDIRTLCREARQRGVLTVIDAAQSVGWAVIHVQEIGCDALVGCSRKFFCALDGMAWLFIRPELLERLTLVAPGPFSVKHDRDYLRHEMDWRPDAWRLTGGAIGTPDVFAMEASLDLFEPLGVKGIQGRCLALNRVLRRGLDKSGTGYLGREWEEQEHSATLFIPGVATAVTERIRAAKISVGARFGGIRVSVHAFNTEEEVERLVALLGGAA